MKQTQRTLLLLCCRLGEPVQPLSRREYAFLETLLEPSEPPEAIAQRLGADSALTKRVMALLDRPEQPERYLAARPDIRALDRCSAEFPARLFRLGEQCPPVIFCRGDVSLFRLPCMALVGSRQLLPRGARFARRVGELAAREGYVLVSGNALGADRVAQEACLACGGQVISVLPDALESHLPRKGQLLICDEGYDCGFTAQRALRRNHLIHALGEKTFVAQCPECSGGTWSGAEDNLRRGLSPVFVLRDGSRGVQALVRAGACEVDDELASLRQLQPKQLSIFD